MSFCRVCLCCLLLLMLVEGRQQYTGPCDNARVIKDDWRYPSEENERKCDNRLRPGMWYKFKYQGQSAVIAQGPIKENHCSTSGPISVSLQSDTHLYPPPPGQSALYKACVHVTVMGVVTCVDHLTIPLLVMTCPDNDVIYFVNKTIRECPSAFCITGRDESVDRYYLIDAIEDERYYSIQPPDQSTLEIQQLSSSQMDGLVTYVTNQRSDESVTRIEELKRHIAKALNLKSWNNCLGGSANRSTSCLDYEKSLIRSSITALGHIISEDSNDTWADGASLYDVHEEVRNASRLSYESSMLKFASSLCLVQSEDVKIINLNPRTTQNSTRTSLFVESFCGITRGSDLIRSLVWLNSTEILSSLVEADVIFIFKGLPVDQLPSTIIPEFWMNSGVWVSIFCCSFVVLSSISLVYFFLSIKCVSNNHMNQKEKIFLIDCDGKTQWLSGPIKRSPNKGRSRRNTLTSVSKEAFQRQVSSTSGRRFSSTSKSTIVSYLKTPPIRFKNWLRIEEKETVPKRQNESNRVEKSKSIFASSNRVQVDDDLGWMVPLQEFKKPLTVPRLVVDTKRHNRGTRDILALN